MAVVSATLLTAALVAISVAACYAGVAWLLHKRSPADPNDRWALQHFVVWWGATAANILAASVLYIAAAFDRLTLPLQLADSIVQRLLLALSLWGLLTYLLYLITGRRYGRITAALYTVHAAFMIGMIFRNEPIGVFIGKWRTDLQYAHTAPPGFDLANFVVIVLAPVLASIVYLAIGIRLPRRGHQEQKFRAILIASALIFWWVVAVLAGQRSLLDLEWLQIVNRSLGLVAAFVILVAYNPPSTLRRRWAAARPTTVAA